MKDMYSDGTYKENAPSWHTEDSAWKVDKILDAIRREGLKYTCIGEVGCGAGEVLWGLSSKLPENTTLVGFDPSPQAATMQRRDPSGRVRFFTGDFLAASGEHFDILLLIDVLEHVPDYLGFLHAIRGRADTFIFHIPLDLTVYHLLHGRILVTNWESLGHLHFFTRDTAVTALTSCGYSVLHDEYTNWIDELPHRSNRQPVVRGALRVLKRFCSTHLAVRALGGHSLLVVAK